DPVVQQSPGRRALLGVGAGFGDGIFEAVPEAGKLIRRREPGVETRDVQPVRPADEGRKTSCLGREGIAAVPPGPLSEESCRKVLPDWLDSELERAVYLAGERPESVGRGLEQFPGQMLRASGRPEVQQQRRFDVR